MGKDLIPVAREYDTSILNIDPTILGKKLYEAAFPSWKRATIEIASLEQMKAQGQKRTRADVRRYIHEKIGGIMKHHAVIGKILSEYCPESPTCTEYNALGHKLPSKGLLDKADKIISFRLHPDKFPHDPKQQKLVTNILFETKGAIEFLRNPDKEARKLHEVIIKATENNPKTAAKIGAIFAEAKGQKGVQSEIPKSAGKLKGRTALIATGVVLSALAVYAAYKALQGRDKKKSNDGTKNDIEYKGVNENVSILGQSQVDSATGTLIGGVAGGVVGTVIHNEAKTASARGRLDAVLDNEENLKSVSSGLKKLGISGIWTSASRGVKAGVLAVSSALIGNAIGGVSGVFRGKKKYAEAKAQFDGLVDENKQLRDKLTAQEAQTEHPQKSFVAAEDLRRASSKQQTSAGVPSVA